MWRFVLSESVDMEALGHWLLWALATLGQGQTTRVEQDFANWHLTAYRVGDMLRVDMKSKSHLVTGSIGG